MLMETISQSGVGVRTETMAAIVQPAYGSVDVLRYEQVERPMMSDDEVLVRVRASAISKGDVHLLTGKPYLVRLAYGVRRPKYRIAGQNLAGTVEAVGKNVTGFSVGDEVYGQGHGAFAEYASVAAATLAHKPANVTFEEAAAVPDSGMTALQALRDAGKLKAGQRVLINGASGGVGTFAVQIAKALGAEVTAICSTKHVDKLRSIGADHVIDYTHEDFATNGKQYDVLLDLVGNRSMADCRAVLETKGIYISCAGSPSGNWIGPIVWTLGVIIAGMFASQTMAPFLVKPDGKDLDVLKSLIEAGKVTPVVEGRYTLRETAQAIQHVANGHAQGKSVITI